MKYYTRLSGDGAPPTAPKNVQEFFAEEVRGASSFASQHTFTIRYKAGEDVKLATHVDQSSVSRPASAFSKGF